MKPLFSQPEIDQLSDGLKRAMRTSNAPSLPEMTIKAWFINTKSGPEFYTGAPRTHEHITSFQPLFGTPARYGDKPCAWLSREGGCGIVITQDRGLYRDDLTWEPLYLARYWGEQDVR